MRGQIIVIALFLSVVLGVQGWQNAPGLFGRSRGRLNSALLHLPSFLFHYFLTLFLVEHPFRFLHCHLFRRTLPGAEVRFRSGIHVKVSKSPDDIASLFCIFVKKDYGKIRKGSVVVDVGANIGIYTLYALHSGAKKVYAFEPSEESFQLLQENLQNNRFTGQASCHRFAVTGHSGDRLLFPRSSDPSNVPRHEGDETDCDWVTTISLADILAQNELSMVHHLKLDCEGAEYAIVQESPPEVWNRIQDVKLEYHRGAPDQLLQRLTATGFLRQSHIATTGTVGHLWLQRNLQVSDS